MPFYQITGSKMMQGDITMDTSTVRAVLMRSTYTFSQAHDFFDDLGTNAVGSDGSTGTFSNGIALANKTFSATAVFDNTVDITFTTVSQLAAETINALVILQVVTGATDSQLLAYIPFTAITPNGGSIAITFNASGIWQLQAAA